MRRRTAIWPAFLAATAGFCALMAVILAGVGALHRRWANAAAMSAAGRGWTEQPAPPEPRLQADPAADLDALERGWSQELSHYAWNDRRRGLARVPVERAMQLMLSRGFPTRGRRK